MEVANGFNQLSRVDLSSFLGELLLLAEVREKLASIQGVYYEVELGSRLKSEKERDNVVALDMLQNFSFCLRFHQ